MPRRSFSRTSSQPPISARTSPASSWAILLPCLAAGRMFAGDAVLFCLGTTRAQWIKNNPAGYNPQGSDWILGD